MLNEFRKNRKLWFKAKRYGWGWTPVSWEGWLITMIYVVLIIQAALNVGQLGSVKLEAIYLLSVIIPSTLLFLIICFLHGESPHWSWGDRKEKNLTNKDQ